MTAIDLIERVHPKVIRLPIILHQLQNRFIVNYKSVLTNTAESKGPTDEGDDGRME